MPTSYSNATKTINLSLVTYSRNDHDLVRAALADVLNWSLLPKEIIVVDDCSTPPLTAADLPPLPDLPAVRILRNPKHFGFTGAKSLGLNSAACRFILSLDADIRLAPNWLELSLKNASRPDIGLLSGPIVPRCGNHLLGRYMALTYNMNVNAQGEVNFLPGAAWLMRQELWQNLGGVNDYQMEAGVDDFFCRKLKAKGYKLWLQKEAEAFEVRPISRQAMIKRGWKWQGASFKRELAAKRIDLDALTEAANVLLYSMRPRLARSAQADLRFLYYDLLYLLYALFDLLNQPDEPPNLTNKLAHSLAAWLSKHPALQAALANDLSQLGHRPVASALLEGSQPTQNLPSSSAPLNSVSGNFAAACHDTGPNTNETSSASLPFNLKQPDWPVALAPFFNPVNLNLLATALPDVLEEHPA